MLVVTVSLLLGMRGAFSNVSDFMYSYVGEYTACLMEYGELPTLGVSDTDLKNHTGGSGKVCDTKFGGFTLAGGIQSNGGSGGSTPSGSGNSSSSTSNSANGKSSRSASSSSSDSSANKKAGDSSDDASALSGAKSSASPYDSGKISRANSKSGFGTADGRSNLAGNDKVKIIEEGDGTGSSRSDRDNGLDSRSRVHYQRDNYKAITGPQEEELRRHNRAPKAPTAKVLTVIDEGGRLGPRKSTITPPERKTASMEDKGEEGFSFGKFMKWLIIAAMFIAIFLFFGSQVMNFMNSKEK